MDKEIIDKETVENNKKILEKFDISESSSNTDCTGLIQIPALSYDEWMDYNEIVSFAPPKPIVQKRE